MICYDNYNLPMYRRLITLSSILLLTGLISCAPQQTPPTDAGPAELTPYLTTTRSPSATSEGLAAAETPLPSPTPFTYTVERGETMSSIALKFGVSIDALQAANPEISPNAMSVGEVLLIPSEPENLLDEATPTPVPFMVRQIECLPTTDTGMWCFVLVHNDTPEIMENISAQVTLVDASESVLASQTAYLPLNILPPDHALPLSVFFPPPIPVDARPRVQVLTGIRLLPGDERYLPATVQNTLVQIVADGRTASVSGRVLLRAESGSAGQVWIAATVYDSAGRVVGVRRWESDAGLTPGRVLPFEFMVSSLGGRIADVEFAVEARP